MVRAGSAIGLSATGGAWIANPGQVNAGRG
jgi:hypothetical protein